MTINVYTNHSETHVIELTAGDTQYIELRKRSKGCIVTKSLSKDEAENLIKVLKLKNLRNNC